jgi:hypothetical protein
LDWCQCLLADADTAEKIAVAAEVARFTAPGSTGVSQRAPAVVHARLAAGIRIEQAELTSGLAATLRHAAPMHNPLLPQAAVTRGWAFACS